MAVLCWSPVPCSSSVGAMHALSRCAVACSAGGAGGATCNPIPVPHLTSPLQVYAWFMIVFRLSVGVGFAGYVLLLLEFTGVGLLLRPLLGPGAALTGAQAAGSQRAAPAWSQERPGCRAAKAQLWRFRAPVPAVAGPACLETGQRGCPVAALQKRGLLPEAVRLPLRRCPVLWPSCSCFGPARPFAAAAIWYGLYYGILTRDSAEVASDRIALSLGTGRKLSVSVRNCGICGGELGDDGLGPAGGSSGGGSSSKGLGTMQLSCKHLFHTECIRWACRMLPGCQGRMRVAWQSSAVGSCRRRDVGSMLLCPRCGGDQVGSLHAACL